MIDDERKQAKLTKSIGKTTTSGHVGAALRPRCAFGRPVPLYVARTLLVVLMVAAPGTLRANHISHTSLNISHSSSKESVKIGNTKTNNYNIAESKYAPTQMTQVVVNLPKLKKMRKLRPPTEEEFAIKRRVLQVYNEAKAELTDASSRQQKSPAMDHLGSILEALNPKYIATYRVRHVAFADPKDPTTQLTDTDPELDQLIAMDLRASPGPIETQLDALSDRFRGKFFWDEQFMANLLASHDQELTPTQLAWKRLLICLDDDSLCLPEGQPVDAKQLVEPPQVQTKPAVPLESNRQSEAPEQHRQSKQPKRLQQPKQPEQRQQPKQSQPCEIDGDCERQSEQGQLMAEPPKVRQRPRATHRAYQDSTNYDDQFYQANQQVYHEQAEPIYDQQQQQQYTIPVRPAADNRIPANIYGQPPAVYQQQPPNHPYRLLEQPYQSTPSAHQGSYPQQPATGASQPPVTRAALRYWRAASLPKTNGQYPLRYRPSNYLSTAQPPQEPPGTYYRRY